MDRVSNYFFLPQKPPGLSAQNPSINETQRASIIDDLDSTSESEMSENAAPPMVSLLERFIGSQFVKDVASVACYVGGAIAAPGIALCGIGGYLSDSDPLVLGFCAIATAPFLFLGLVLFLPSEALYYTSLSISHPARSTDDSMSTEWNILRDIFTFNRNLDEPIVTPHPESSLLPSPQRTPELSYAS